MGKRMFVLGSYVSGLTIRVPRPPVPGETLVGTDFDWGPGGKGFNQAVAAARLGARVELAVAIGDDVFGQIALDTLAREKVEARHCLRLDGWHSGVGFVTLTASGENSIVLDLGANRAMTPPRLAAFEPALLGCDLFLTQLELPLETVAEALRLAKTGGALCVLNPAPAPAGPLPKGLLECVDVLTPNETELRLLLGRPPDDATPTAELAGRLAERGPDRLVVTRGGAGALAIDGGAATGLQALELKPVDVTGAGDAFNACLAVGLLDGQPLPEAARRATAAGGYCTQHLGVIDGLPTREQLEAFEAAHA